MLVELELQEEAYDDQYSLAAIHWDHGRDWSVEFQIQILLCSYRITLIYVSVNSIDSCESIDCKQQKNALCTFMESHCNESWNEKQTTEIT